jgi:hypothetical protein
MDGNSVAKSGSMTDRAGKLICLVITCMDTTCLHCHTPVGQDGMFFALGEPYCGCVHRNCIWNHNYDGNWPHKYPAVAYNK